MNRLLASALCATTLLSACGRSEPPPAPVAAPAAPVLTSGIDRSTFDASVRPQDDLYRAVNGSWLKNTPIPADKSNYGSFTRLADDAEAQLRVIIEELAAKTDKAPGSIEQKVGDFYASFMDEAALNQRGPAVLAPDFERIRAIDSRGALLEQMAALVREGVNMPMLVYVHQDAKDSTQYAGDFWQGGLGLPDRDFYLLQDAKFAGIREAYVAHISAMLGLIGEPEAAAKARTLLALETRLAEGHVDKVINRDPVKRYNRLSREALASLAPQIDWNRFLSAVGYGDLAEVLVSQPGHVASFGKLLEAVPLEDWKLYLRWRVLSTAAPLLSQPLVDESFAFYGRTLNGIQENQPRWKRGVAAVEEALGEAVGQVYVQRHFPAENKARMEAMVKNLIQAYGRAIDQLEWMGTETKKAAREKLAKFTYKIGYPNRWRDYSRLEVQAGDLLGNVRRAQRFEYERNLAKLGQPIDREEWGMTPQTVNAYYNPEKNEIVFPAAILQPPFFDVRAEDAVNYGGIGAVIGHEISHGFDDKGSQYDGDGNLRMWWTAEDRARFEALGARLAAQYDAYEPVKGYRVNGKFTLGENIADLGGLTVAHQAYKLSLGGLDGPVIDGLSADQRFFMGWAQVWRRNYREENLLNRLKTDPHSPSEYRCNGVVTHLPGYYAAFEVQETDRLYTAPESRIKIW
ncbi:MAG TPA: M13-type metalloendopeptidase [Nevskiaceae bacterium]|nr:M13-type metalloendopeptidase [Nevskiaceae bacterium]